jgi:glycosyltransferase involved in cell wall biosynthesis
MPRPSVDVVIPTRNRLEPLTECLLRLIPYVSAHAECQIIVSDDGVASQTVECLAVNESFVRVVQGPRSGPAANRNNGARQSAGELIIFFDDDCIPDPSIILAYQDAASQHPDVGVFEGRISAIGTAKSFADTAPSNETGG